MLNGFEWLVFGLACLLIVLLMNMFPGSLKIAEKITGKKKIVQDDDA